MKILYSLLVLFISINGLAQNSSVFGTITDSTTNEPIPFANVTLLKNGEAVMRAVSDFDGNYIIIPVDSGNYSILFSLFNNNSLLVKGVEVESKLRSKVEVNYNFTNNKKDTILWTEKGNLYSMERNRNNLSELKGFNKNNEIRNVCGLKIEKSVADNTLNVRCGGRGGDVFFIDGLKITGNTNIPRTIISEVTVKVGGVSARYEHGSPRERYLDHNEITYFDY